MNAIDHLFRARTVSALCADPPVLAAYDSDFAAHAGELAAFARERPRAVFLLQLGFEHESDEAADRLAGSSTRATRPRTVSRPRSPRSARTPRPPRA